MFVICGASFDQTNRRGGGTVIRPSDGLIHIGKLTDRQDGAELSLIDQAHAIAGIRHQCLRVEVPHPLHALAATQESPPRLSGTLGQLNHQIKLLLVLKRAP